MTRGLVVVAALATVALVPGVSSAQRRPVRVIGVDDAAVGRALDAELAAAGLARTSDDAEVTVEVTLRSAALRATVTRRGGRSVLVEVPASAEDAEGLFALRVAEAVQAASTPPASVTPRPPRPAPPEPRWAFGLDALLRVAPGATGGPVWVSPSLRVAYGASLFGAVELSAPTAGGAMTDEVRVSIYAARVAAGYAWRWPRWFVDVEVGATAAWVTLSGADGGSLIAMIGGRLGVARRLTGPLWARATVGGDSLNSPARVARGASVLAEWASPSVTFTLGPLLRY